MASTDPDLILVPVRRGGIASADLLPSVAPHFMERVLGLDVGTSHAAVAVVNDGAAVVLPDAAGRPLMPSVVAFAADGPPLVGLEARRRRAQDPAATFHNLRRLLGRPALDAGVLAAQSQLGYPVVAGPDGGACVWLRGHPYHPSELLALLMVHLRERAEATVGEPVRKAVVVARALSAESERQALRLAASMAGLEVVRILSTPAACGVLHAACAPGEPHRLLSCDVGAGTMEASVVDVAPRCVRVLSVAGDAERGADVLDELIVEMLREQVMARYQVDPLTEVVAAQRMWGAAEGAKIHLTEHPSVDVRLRELFAAEHGMADLEQSITRADLRQRAKGLWDTWMHHVGRALERASDGTEEVGGVLMSGGGSRDGGWVDVLSRSLRRPLLITAQHDGAAAQGAALYGHALVNREGGAAGPLSVVACEVLGQPIWLSVEGAGGKERVFEDGSPLPAAASRVLPCPGPALLVRLWTGEDGSWPLSQVRIEPPGKARGGGPARVSLDLEVDVDGLLWLSAVDPEGGLRTAQAVRPTAQTLEEAVLQLRVRRGEAGA